MLSFTSLGLGTTRLFEVQTAIPTGIPTTVYVLIRWAGGSLAPRALRKCVTHMHLQVRPLRIERSCVPFIRRNPTTMPAGALRSPIVELHHARPLYQSGASLIGLLGWWTWPELHGRPKECALAFLRRTL